MKRLIIACALLLSSALFADTIQSRTNDIQISADSADKNVDRLYYNFGTIPQGSMSYVNYYVTNVGERPLFFREARLSGPGYFARHNCGGVLPPRGGRCTFTIEFAPYYQGYYTGQFMMAFDQYTVIVDLAGQAYQY